MALPVAINLDSGDRCRILQEKCNSDLENLKNVKATRSKLVDVTNTPAKCRSLSSFDKILLIIFGKLLLIYF